MTKEIVPQEKEAGQGPEARQTGIFYGVGVGPGDPELLTVKAIKTLERCPVWAVPKTRQGNSLALDIARLAVEPGEKEIIYLEFLMTRDPERLAENHRQNAERITAVLDTGRDVAMPNLGDVSLYSTFSYLQAEVEARGYATAAVPGVTSFCAAAASLGISLTEMGKPLHIIPAGETNLEANLALEGTRVLMKSGKEIPRVKEALREAGLWDKSSLAVNVGLPGERLHARLSEAELRQAGEPGYFSVILVKD